MKRFYLFSALTLLCILIFCDSRATGKSTPNIVPANAEIVALVDLERISSLSGISLTDIVPMLCEQNADPMVRILQTLATDKSLGSSQPALYLLGPLPHPHTGSSISPLSRLQLQPPTPTLTSPHQSSSL